MTDFSFVSDEDLFRALKAEIVSFLYLRPFPISIAHRSGLWKRELIWHWQARPATPPSRPLDPNRGLRILREVILDVLPHSEPQFKSDLFPQASLLFQYRPEYILDNYECKDNSWQKDYYKLRPYCVLHHPFEGDDYTCTLW